MIRCLILSKKQGSIALLCLVWCAFVRAQIGWWMESSCLTVPNFIGSVNNAFDFARTAVLLYGEGNPSVVHAAHLLFEEDTINLAMAKLAGVAAMGAYKGVLVNLQLQTAPNDVVFSCGFSMLNSQTKTYPNGRELIWATNGQYAEPIDSTYSACRYGPVAGAPVIDAYTITWSSPRAPNLIRFCPVFLAQIAAQRWSSSEQIDPQWLIDIPPEAAAVMAFQTATPADLYGLFELVILHELTHTKNGGQTKDWASPIKKVGSGGFNYATNVGADAYNNAETVAFMGLLSKLAQLGFEVDANGNLEVIAASVRKRSLGNMFHFDKKGKTKLNTTLVS